MLRSSEPASVFELSYAEIVTLWTRSVEIRWRTGLRFFESRIGLLRELENRGLVDAFRWRESDFDVRIEEFENLSIGVNGASLTLNTPRKTADRLIDTLGIAIDILSPTEMTFQTTRNQCLFAVDQTPKELQRETGRTMVPELGEVSTDWAMLLDGMSHSLKASFQVEYGIVGASEVLARLNRQIGRVDSTGLNSLARSLGDMANPEQAIGTGVDPSELPSTALFLDWHWFVFRDLPDGEAQSVVKELLDMSEVETTKNSVNILNRLKLKEIDSDMPEANA